MDVFYDKIFMQEISPEDFKKLSDAIYRYCGINLPENKKNLLEGRVRKRIKQLGLGSFENYVNYVFSPEGLENEITPLIDVITTNKTDFFRENMHYDFLVNTALPELEAGKKNDFVLDNANVWSAGCSTGEEPYTLAMILSEYAEVNRGFTFTLFASDISTEALKHAVTGVYEYDKIEVISSEMKKKYLMKHKNPEKKIVKIVPELQRLVRFERINFMDSVYNLPHKMDIVFCRNVLIYFDKATQEKVIRNIANNLNPGGFLFLGHSESTMGMKLPIERVASTIYRKK